MIYLLFGSEAVSYYTGLEFEKIKNTMFEIFKITENTDPLDLLRAYNGWEDYCKITEKEYLKLQEL